MKKSVICYLLVLSVFLMVFCSCKGDNNLIEGRYSKIEVEHADSTKNKTISETKTIVDYINSLDCVETVDGEEYYGADLVLVFYDENEEKKGAVVAAADQLTVFGTVYTVSREAVEDLVDLCYSTQ